MPRGSLSVGGRGGGRVCDGTWGDRATAVPALGWRRGRARALLRGVLPCSLAASEKKPFAFSQPLLMLKVIPSTGVGGSGLSPSVAILCLPRGF